MRIRSLYIYFNVFTVINFFLLSLGLIGLAKGIAFIVAPAFIGKASLITNEYLNSFFNPAKSYELIAYLLGVIFLFVYYLFGYFNFRRIKKFYKKNYVYLNKPAYHFLYILFLFCFNMLLIKSYKSIIGTIIGMLLWIIIVVCPILYNRLGEKVIEKFNIWIRKYNQILLNNFFLIAILLQAFLAFYPYVSNNYKFMNEYLDLPEETLVQGEYVSNNEYYSKHKILNNTNKYNLEADFGENPLPTLSANISKTELIKNFIRKYNIKYYYDDELNALCLVGIMSIEERDFLLNIVQNAEEKTKIEKLYFYSKEVELASNEKELQTPEKEFLDKNRFELHWQILNRWVIHHHNFILGPINEYALGKDLKDIFMQYGWLNILLIKNIMEWLGGISYNNYFIVFFSFYFIYYSSYVGITYWIFRKISYTLVVSALAFASQNSIGFQFLFLGPGMNPIRHFFDIFVLGLFYAYCRHGRIRYLLISLMLCFIAILNNNQFGLFLLVALLFSAMIKSLRDGYKMKYIDILILITSSILGIVIFAVSKIGPDYMSKYYLAGLLGAPLSMRTFFLILLFISIGYLILLKSYKKKVECAIIGLFLLIYSQELLIYYVWGGVSDHFKALVPIYALTAVYLLKILIDNNITIKKHEKAITTALVIISLCFYIPSVGKYYKTKQEFDRVFDTHQTYQWNMERGHFVSTMNPKYFEDSIQLIQKYSPQNGIYMISKYDAFLPFMAKRYNAMPYIEMSQFLITKNEMQNVIDTVNSKQPEFLFVDTDINRNLNTDIVNSKAPNIGYLHNESVWRVQRLNLLKDVFNAVRDDYEPLEKALLVTVYQRKNKIQNGN